MSVSYPFAGRCIVSFFFFEEEEEEGMMMTCLVLVDSFFMRLQGVSTERANEPSHVRMRVSRLRAISSF